MDEELKKHLDRIEKNMATKSELAEVRKEMATKKDFEKLDKKIDKLNKDLVGYMDHLDSEFQLHRRNSEAHLKVPAL